MNRAVVPLVGHSLRRAGAVVAGLALLLAGFEFLLTQVAGYFLRQSAFSQLSTLMPDFIRSALGPSSLAFMSFSGIVSFGYFHPIVIAAAVGLTIWLVTEPAGEIEYRFVDLTLARGLTRFDLIVRTVIVFVIAAIVVLGLMMAGTWTGLACCTPANAPRPSGRLIVSLAVSLGTVMACWAGVGLAVAVSVKRRVVAATSVGVIALAAYLLDYLGRAWEPARAISRLSPFHFFDPTALVTGAPLNRFNVTVLIAIGMVGTIAAAIVFSRRDI
jgi:ABC-type transport system involved in multi-copper enzyme maturation permease subunit